MVVTRNSPWLPAFLVSPERLTSGAQLRPHVQRERVLFRLNGERLWLHLSPPAPQSRSAGHGFKEPKLCSVSILTLFNKSGHLHIGYKGKKSILELSFQVGLEMGLKGLREFDGIENLGEEKPKGLLFPVEENIPTEPAHGVLRWSKAGLRLRTGEKMD